MYVSIVLLALYYFLSTTIQRKIYQKLPPVYKVEP
jgi:hypothetical protein